MNLKKFIVGGAAGALMLGALAASAFAAPDGHGIMNPGDDKGVPLYVIIEVEWDGDTTHDGSWRVWGPVWDPVVGGTMLSSCPIGPLGTCVGVNYDFQFKGKTVQFDEVYVSGVAATPQTHHVVLHDTDGDGIYTGSLSAARYEYQPGYLYLDRIDYEISFGSDGKVTGFRYLEYEHKKLLE